MNRMSLLLIFIFLMEWSALHAQPEKPSLNLMWSRTENNKNRVYDIEEDSIKINFSELNKWTASTVKSCAILEHINFGPDTGRFIIYRDSATLQQYRVIDYARLTTDSLLLYEFQGSYADKEAAMNHPKTGRSDYKMHYTVEYLYYQKVAKTAPDLKKEEYMNFLKDVQAQAKKAATEKKLDMDPSKPIDRRMNEFISTVARQKTYKGKIFPHTLARAQDKFKKDEAANKLTASIRSCFVVKKGDAAVAAGKPDKGKQKAENTAGNTRKNGGTTEKPNGVKITSGDK